MVRTPRLLLTLFLVSLISLCATCTFRLLRAQESHLKSLQGAIRRVEARVDASWEKVALTSAQQKSLDAAINLLHGVDGRQQQTLGRVRGVETALVELQKTLAESAVRQRFMEAYDVARRELTERVQRLQQPDNCHLARFLGCHIALRACGFTCQMHTLADCMTSALLSNRTAVVVPPQLYVYGTECNSAWTCFLQPLSPCNGFAENTMLDSWYNWTVDSPHQFTMYGAWGEDPYRVPQFLDDRLGGAVFRTLTYVPTAPCLLTGVLLRWALRPNARLEEAIRKRRGRLRLTSAIPDAGVHVRRTDKVREKEALQYDLRYYMMHVDHFVAPTTYHHAGYGRLYNKHVFIMSDSDITEELQQFPEYNFTVALPLREGRWDRDSLDLFLCDVLYLAQLPYFVGTLSSQGSRLVAELRAAGENGAESFRTMASLDAGYYKGVQARLPWPRSMKLTPANIIHIYRRKAAENHMANPVGPAKLHAVAPAVVLTARPAMPSALVSNQTRWHQTEHRVARARKRASPPAPPAANTTLLPPSV
eukprot:GGOE01058781.1.p1 GENE.GGOE01058781.1~~GGOE01058781.1.p1  ORF type:complete len:535 (-),score=124.45 GGOE01058781.1:488-2092(-)